MPAMDELNKYLSHLEYCGAVGSIDPRDYGCSCGLRQIYHKIDVEYAKLKKLRK